MDDINALRTELFATIRALRDEKNPMDIARAKAVGDVAQTIINSAKVEVDMINAVGAKRLTPTNFIGNALPAPEPGKGTVVEGRFASEPVPGRGLPPKGPAAKP